MPTMADLAGFDAPAVRAALLAWYDQGHRPMPWRFIAPARPDPYHVLVSEAMLQQTQVATVIAYFHRFIAAFPTLAALAAADEQQVLRQWQGLGYYRRARNLHRAAKQIVVNHGGEVPADVAALRELPGVGPYTAGAIASIAFALPEAVVDGNVARVLARWLALRHPIDKPATQRWLWHAARVLAPSTSADRPGDYNQAVMELGAMVCSPRSPTCSTCPVARWCRAKAMGLADQLPVVSPRRRPTTQTHHILALRRGRRLLFSQRPDTGLWAGMWQMPTLETDSGQISPATIMTWGREHLGLTLADPSQTHAFTHLTTHRAITFRLWRSDVEGGRLARGAGQWRELDDLTDLPLSNPQRRIVALLRNQDNHPPARRRINRGADRCSR